jgi:hypothetical protein
MAGTVSLNEARRALSSLGRRGKTTKIPGPIRDVVMAYVQETRSSGRRWGEIAQAVGLSTSVLQRWARATPARRSRLKRVSIREFPAPHAAPALVLVTAQGDRVEGLGVEQAVALLRGLRAGHLSCR